MTNYRFGKHPPKQDYRTLRMEDYFRPSLPAPPPSYSVLPRVYQNLKISDPTKLFPMDRNDSFGDCTIAGVAHAVTVYRGLIGKKDIMSAAAVQKLYFSLTGGNDTGLDELTVLNHWRKHSIAGDKILAFVSVNPKNLTQVQQAIQLFGGLYIGFQCQQNVIADFEAHKPWTKGKLTNEGHAVYVVGYDQQYINTLTWGSTQLGDYLWWNQTVDDCFAILPSEAKNAQFDPGFDFAQLQADLAAVAS